MSFQLDQKRVIVRVHTENYFIIDTKPVHSELMQISITMW
jgi:hypothetical protein